MFAELFGVLHPRGQRPECQAGRDGERDVFIAENGHQTLQGIRCVGVPDQGAAGNEQDGQGNRGKGCDERGEFRSILGGECFELLNGLRTFPEWNIHSFIQPHPVQVTCTGRKETDGEAR